MNRDKYKTFIQKVTLETILIGVFRPLKISI